MYILFPPLFRTGSCRQNPGLCPHCQTASPTKSCLRKKAFQSEVTHQLTPSQITPTRGSLLESPDNFTGLKSYFTFKRGVSTVLQTTWYNYQLSKQNGLVCFAGPAFRAWTVTGTFERRLPRIIAPGYYSRRLFEEIPYLYYSFAFFAILYWLIVHTFWNVLILVLYTLVSS